MAFCKTAENLGGEAHAPVPKRDNFALAGSVCRGSGVHGAAGVFPCRGTQGCGALLLKIKNAEKIRSFAFEDGDRVCRRSEGLRKIFCCSFAALLEFWGFWRALCLPFLLFHAFDRAPLVFLALIADERGNAHEGKHIAEEQAFHKAHGQRAGRVEQRDAQILRVNALAAPYAA